MEDVRIVKILIELNNGEVIDISTLEDSGLQEKEYEQVIDIIENNRRDYYFQKSNPKIK